MEKRIINQVGNFLGWIIIIALCMDGSRSSILNYPYPMPGWERLFFYFLLPVATIVLWNLGAKWKKPKGHFSAERKAPNEIEDSSRHQEATAETEARGTNSFIAQLIACENLAAPTPREVESPIAGSIISRNFSIGFFLVLLSCFLFITGFKGILADYREKNPDLNLYLLTEGLVQEKKSKYISSGARHYEYFINVKYKIEREVWLQWDQIEHKKWDELKKGDMVKILHHKEQPEKTITEFHYYEEVYFAFFIFCGVLPVLALGAGIWLITRAFFAYSCYKEGRAFLAKIDSIITEKGRRTIEYSFQLGKNEVKDTLSYFPEKINDGLKPGQEALIFLHPRLDEVSFPAGPVPEKADTARLSTSNNIETVETKLQNVPAPPREIKDGIPYATLKLSKRMGCIWFFLFLFFLLVLLVGSRPSIEAISKDPRYEKLRGKIIEKMDDGPPITPYRIKVKYQYKGKSWEKWDTIKYIYYGKAKRRDSVAIFHFREDEKYTVTEWHTDNINSKSSNDTGAFLLILLITLVFAGFCVINVRKYRKDSICFKNGRPIIGTIKQYKKYIFSCALSYTYLTEHGEFQDEVSLAGLSKIDFTPGTQILILLHPDCDHISTLCGIFPTNA
ncbi:hypothetical protein ACFL35_07940 [Candidatus Riflebacteria bacterium]